MSRRWAQIQDEVVQDDSIIMICPSNSEELDTVGDGTSPPFCCLLGGCHLNHLKSSPASYCIIWADISDASAGTDSQLPIQKASWTPPVRSSHQRELHDCARISTALTEYLCTCTCRHDHKVTTIPNNLLIRPTTTLLTTGTSSSTPRLDIRESHSFPVVGVPRLQAT